VRAWRVVGALIALLIFVFAFLPLLSALRSAHLPEMFEEESLEALRASLSLGGLVVCVAVPVGAAIAWLIERTDTFSSDQSRARALAFFSVPVAIPPYLLGIAWLLLGNGKSGLLNRGFSWIDLYGLDGMVLVLATSSYPFALLAVRSSLLRADPSLEEAARVSGAGPWRVLTGVTLPLVVPAIAASAGLVLVFTLAAFGVPYLFGENRLYVLTTRIYQFVTLGGEKMMDRAASLALLLLMISVAAQALLSAWARRRSSVQVSGKTARRSLVLLGKARTPLRAALLVLGTVFILVPLLTIAWTSLVRTFADPLVLSDHHWRAVLGRAETLRAFSHSIVLALGTGILVAVIGLLVARIGGPLASLAAAPYSVPGTVLAIGMILTFSQELRVIAFEQVTFAFRLPGTLWMLLIAYAVKHLAFGVRGASTALAQIHPSLEEAARTSGAGSMRSFYDVILPLIAPAAVASFLIAALTCLSELTMSVLLFGANTETAGTLLFELQSYSDPPAAAVVATLVIITAIAGDAAVRAIERRKRSTT
jgi:iron(III) transport system permease protein